MGVDSLLCFGLGISCCKVATSCFLSTSWGSDILGWPARAEQRAGARCAGDGWLAFALLGGYWSLLEAVEDRLKQATGSSQLL